MPESPLKEGPSSDDDDQVLSFLAKVERLLKRLNEGVLIFIFKKIPKRIYDVAEALIRHFREYFDWAIRVSKSLGKITLFLLVLTFFVIGPPLVFSYFHTSYFVWGAWAVSYTHLTLPTKA